MTSPKELTRYQKSLNLAVGEKDYLYKELHKNSGLTEKEVKAAKEFDAVYRELIEELYGPDLIELITVNNRVSATTTSERASGSTLFPDIFGENSYPNSKWPNLEHRETQHLYIIAERRVDWENPLPTSKVLSSEKDINVLLNEKFGGTPKFINLKGLFQALMEAMYAEKNYLADYWPGLSSPSSSRPWWNNDHFLGKASTWGRVANINPEWGASLVRLFPDKAESPTEKATNSAAVETTEDRLISVRDWLALEPTV